MTCVYVPPANPRVTSCLRCGKPAVTHPEPVPTTRVRDIASERLITREAARGAVDPEALIGFSEMRSGGNLSGEYVNDPGLVRLGRDRERDVREELSDARNHLVWFIQEYQGSEEAHDAFLALRHILLAYDLMTR